jgi:hypothetical protein
VQRSPLPYPHRSRTGAAFLTLALALLPVAALAGPNKDFEGEWVLDTAKSKNLGDLQRAVQTITLEGENVKIERNITRTEQDPVSFSYTYLTDGNIHKVVGPADFERDVTAEWDGKKLVVKWTFTFQAFEIDAEEIWRTRRKGLEIKRTFSTPGGERIQKLMFTRP